MPNMTADQLRGLISAARDEFLADDDYVANIVAIDEAVRRLWSNVSLSEVIDKVCIIDTLYSTRLPAPTTTARGIVAIPDLDSLLTEGDIKAIAQVRRTGGRDDYVFATKYCHFHNQSYPIFDNLVGQLLAELNSERQFYESFDSDSLRDYEKFRLVLAAFQRYVSATEWSPRQLDHGLWLYAKYRYKRKQLPSAHVQVLDDAQSSLGLS